MRITSLVALLWTLSASADPDQKYYASVRAYLDALPRSDRPFSDGAYGDLAGAGRQDWVGIVRFSRPRPEGGSDPEQDYERIIILTQASNGAYLEAAKSTPIDVYPTFGFNKVRIANRSAYVSSGSAWHECGYSETHQFKLYQGKWRLIGVKFQQGGLTEAEDGSTGQDAAEFDRNVITGNVTAKLTRFNQKPVERHFRVKPQVILLDDLAPGEAFGWSKSFDTYLKDLNTGC
mgnify:FL=1